MTFKEYLLNLKGKRVTVLGMGVSNTPLIGALLEEGIDTTIRDKSEMEKISSKADSFEERGAKLVLGENYLENIEADVIFRTPGLRPDLPEIESALKRGAILTSEMEAFFEVCPCKIIGVTGSDGKTTTTTIIAELLKSAGYTVHIGGNIGTPLLTSADKMKKDDIVVLELSSFQLMTMNVSPEISVITNLSPNHLDVHKDFDEYIDAKKNIFTHHDRNGCTVLNMDNTLTKSFKSAGELRYFSRREPVSNGFYCLNGKIYSSFNGNTVDFMSASDILLPGVHNIENYLAAFSAVHDFVGFDVMKKVAGEFSGVEHRIELVRELDGVKYYNDSIASSPSRTIAGLRSFDRKVILIAGGKDKGVPFDDLGDEICKQVKYLILTGFTAGRIREATEKSENFDGTLPITVTDKFDEAVFEARKAARPETLLYFLRQALLLTDSKILPSAATHLKIS